MPSHKDISGARFGRLTVLHEFLPRLIEGSRWTCRCDCGNEKVAWLRKLRSGKAVSCGCASKEWVASFGGRFVDKAMAVVRKHGHASGGTRSSEYDSWMAMKQRCLNPSDGAWSRYGARGITVCQRWADSFEAFLEDMGPKPTPKHTIDRLRPTGNYEPGNCRWATKEQQGQENKTNLIPLAYDGVMYPSISAACRAAGVNKQSVLRRLWRGTPPDRVFDGLRRH